ncbi:MAG: ATP-binding protein [Candidatus Saccharimonadaceae bacterium]
MKEQKKNKTTILTTIRQKAETQLTKQHSLKAIPLTELNTLRILHELEVHQIELELLNEELILARDKAETIADKYMTLYDFSPTGYFTLDTIGDICEVNLHGAKLLCKERSSLVGNRFALFITQDTLPVFNDFLLRVFATNSKQNCEVRLLANGNQFYFVFIEGIIFENKQKCLLTTFDITELKQLSAMNKESEIRLFELNAAKDKLFSIIAHDLRTPFNSILGFSELLIENVKDYDTAEAAEFLSIISSSAKNTLALLDNLLNWAKIQTGQIDYKFERLILSTIIQEILDISISNAKIKGISLNYMQSADILVYADENMLKTVLRNLISNAIKFTKPGGNINILTISEQNQVEISISDNGVGMDEEARKKLFNISSNITSVGTSNEKGSGLGLVLCKEFVEKLGGKIWVESKKEKGSDFKFTLPLNNSY